MTEFAVEKLHLFYTGKNEKDLREIETFSRDRSDVGKMLAKIKPGRCDLNKFFPGLDGYDPPPPKGPGLVCACGPKSLIDEVKKVNREFKYRLRIEEI